MIARQTAVQTAIQMNGQRNEVVDLYNAYFDAHPKERPRRYRVKFEDMLCATFISSVFIKLTNETGQNWLDIVPPECGAHQLYQNMDALGRGVQDKKRVPEIGDLIFFGNSKYVSGIQHVGIVTEVKNNKQIYYYDIQSRVGRHTCPVGYSYIWGYGMPDYASKDFQSTLPPTPTTEEPKTEREFKVGDLVTINPGAKWYSGSTIKLSCLSDKWYIMQVKGDRIVLGMNEKETRNIISPIHAKDITLVVAQEPVAPNLNDNKVSITVDIDKETYQLLQIMSQGNGKSVGEIIDLLLEDAR